MGNSRLLSSSLENDWPCPAGFSVMNAIDRQMRDRINLGLDRWRMAVPPMETAAESGKVEWSPKRKHQVQPGCEE